MLHNISMFLLTPTSHHHLCFTLQKLVWQLMPWWRLIPSQLKYRPTMYVTTTFQVPVAYIYKLCHHHVCKSMGLYKKDVTPLLTHWSYAFLALTHRNVLATNSARPSAGSVMTAKYSTYSSKLLWLSSFRVNFQWQDDVIQNSCSNLNTLRLRQDGPHFPDDIFKWIEVCS